MDVLRPELTWIDGRCYRKNNVQNRFNNVEERNEDYLDADIGYDDNCYDDYEDNIDELSSGKFQGCVSVPSAFFSYVIGSKGNTKKRVESETRTKLNIPFQGQAGDIVITGMDKKGVSSAMRRVLLLVETIRNKTAPTHFLCIPLNIQQLKENFINFKEDILKKYSNTEGLDVSLFQKPEKLHLTIGTLVLMDERERKMAAKFLEECQKEIIKPLLKENPLDVKVEGIEYMNDDPGAVDVLYAKVSCTDGSNRLQILAQKLMEKFVASGFMPKQYDKVKLHITLINTLFRTSEFDYEKSSGRNRKPRETFNAKQILKEYENYKFATLRINSIHISVLHSTSEDGFYTCSSSISLE
ncbi:activating signal cointegrator 1 complex subunit 1-like [Centruroides vittatus]|uniref:activating signal cointegrator 1 complex subunit 1-like n=1 Tax=Centruroides vittatus TaxID=120091 RepID=UPI003510246B